MLPLKLNEETIPEMYSEIDYCFIISKDLKLIEIASLQSLIKFSAKEEEINNYVGVIIIDNEGNVYQIEKITYKKSIGLNLHLKESKINLDLLKKLLTSYINNDGYENVIICTEDERSLLVSYLKKEIIKEIESVSNLKELSKRFNKTIYFSFADCNMSELSDFKYKEGAVLEYPFNVLTSFFNGVGSILNKIIPDDNRKVLRNKEYFLKDNVFIRFSEYGNYFEEPLLIKDIEEKELLDFDCMFQEGLLYEIKEGAINKIENQNKAFLEIKKAALIEIEETCPDQDQDIFKDMTNKIRNELIEKIKKTKNIEELMYIY